jgi:hypothetical protein
MKFPSFLVLLLSPLSASGHVGSNGQSAAQMHTGSEASTAFIYRKHNFGLKNAWTGRNFPRGTISKGPRTVRIANAGTVGSNDMRKVSKKESKSSATSAVAHSAFPSSAPSNSPSLSPTSSSAPSNVPSTSLNDIPSVVPSDMPSDMPNEMMRGMPSRLPSSLPSVVPSSAPSEAHSVSHTSTQLSAGQCYIPVPRSSNHCALDEDSECEQLRSFL